MPQPSVLITGCTPGGIGHALARTFHAPPHSYRVFATARDPTTIADLAALGIETLPLEATSDASILDLAAAVSARTDGTLDFLVNNAGRSYTVPATDIDLTEVRATFEVNLFAVMRLCQVFAPALVAAAARRDPHDNARRRPPTIVNIGSIAAKFPYVFGAVYNASKAALHAYSETLRVELAPFGVAVAVVVTGGVRTNIARTTRALPEDSLFLPVEDSFVRRLRDSQVGAMDAEEYARRVVDVLIRRPRAQTVWEGAHVWKVWAVLTFLGRWVLDWAMTRTWGLERLRGTATLEGKTGGRVKVD
jgi:1-acylglycerone phosphate reductase